MSELYRKPHGQSSILLPELLREAAAALDGQGDAAALLDENTRLKKENAELERNFAETHLAWNTENERRHDAEAELTSLKAAGDAAPRVERELRIEWWNNHGCPSIARYGDDGEFQCGKCITDFKRMPLDELRNRVYGLRMKRVAEAVNAHFGLEPPATSGSGDEAREEHEKL